MPATFSMTNASMRNFVAHNWFSLLTVAGLVASAIYQFGFQAQYFTSLSDRLTEVIKTQGERTVIIQNLRGDVEKLKWEDTKQSETVRDIQLDVRSTDKRTQEIEKKLEVLIEIMRPSVKKASTP